jgi:ribonuclease P protein component
MGKSYAHPLVVLIKARNNQVQTRIGITAGSAVGNAVQRNRAKRRLRAAIQLHLPVLLPGWDLILIARKPITGARYDQIEACLQALLKKAELIKNSHEMENTGFGELSGGAAPAGPSV